MGGGGQPAWGQTLSLRLGRVPGAPLSGLAVRETVGSLNCPGGFALRLLTLPAGVSQRLRVPVTLTPSSLVPASSGPGPGQSLGTVPARGPRTSWGVSLRCFLGRRGPAGDLGHGRLRALGTQTGCGRGVVLRWPLLRSPCGSRIAPGSAEFSVKSQSHTGSVGLIRPLLQILLSFF